MNRIMRRAEVLAATGLCYSSIFNMMKVGKFPANKKLGCRAVGWVKVEVDSWLANLQSGTAQTV